MTTQTSLQSASIRLRRKIDPAWTALALALLALAIGQPQQFAPSVSFIVDQVVDILPYLALAVGAAAYAGASGADNLIAKAFSGHIALMLPFAALMGALSPFCSCGVIPLIAALLSMGVPLAPVMAFWLASPLMDPSMFVLTSGEIGLDFAIAKTIAAIAMGLFGGVAVLALSGASFMQAPLRLGVGNGSCAGAKVRNPKAVRWAFWRESERTAKFAREGLKSFLFLLKWLSLAYLAESLMVAYAPANAIAEIAGGGDFVSILTAALIGVPTYLNGYAAIPLIGGLFEQGMAQGAGMAFLIAGGVTSLPAAIAVFALVRWPVFALYLVLALSGSVAVGLIYQAWTVI
ncbi:permease [Magnetovibrio sp.]|uniref:permease n=1 Tax=Magnetovibrio sp. TaxID=2024836 RepID=UPI002F9585EF